MDVPEVVLRRRLRAEGFPDHEVLRMLSAGGLTPVRRGAYIIGGLPAAAELRHALRVQAAVDHLADAAVVSHVSAAVLHGLPVWGIALDTVQVTKPRRSGGRCGREVHVYTASLASDEIVVAEGVDATSVARTVVDLARTSGFEQAVAVADAALHAELVSAAELDAALVRATGWPGVPQARRVLAFADARSASVGESRSRVAIARAGLPTPVLQWQVIGRSGWVADVDFGWPKLRTVGEFDGEIKYGRLLKPGQSASDVVFAEKQREDAIRDEDLGVVRWIWADLSNFADTAKRLRRRFRSA
ncbi:hypothetical protein [Pseudonocardia sp. GCM10023141]|uniref:hypothetical protein n=1 Tax=Pseudonocardia sp. GCM10023141 TaxID=3252653 RepID=UPI00361F571B